MGRTRACPTDPAAAASRSRLGRLVARVAWAALLFCVASGFAWALEPPALLRQIRETALDPARSVSLDDVSLEFGEAQLEVERGVLIPTQPIDGRTVELVFVGQAAFRMEPPDEIEAGQVELFTGRRSVETTLEAAVLVVVDPEIVARLLDRQAPHDIGATELARAQAVHETWRKSADRRVAGVESAIFKAMLGDGAFERYFAVWGRGYELNDFVYELDPEDAEPLTMASFSPISVKGWERKRLERHLRVQQRKGRWLGVRVEDIGAWDVWLSAPWAPEHGESFPGNVGFETDHYELDVTVERQNYVLDGRARLHLTAQSSGRRTVTLGLFRDLRVQDVTDDQGRKLFFFRDGVDIVVALPAASEAGRQMTLDVKYRGRGLQWVEAGAWDLLDTAKWYPHCGSVDRATYDVTLRWPRKLQLIAGGRRVDGGRQGRYRWERRLLEEPSLAFSFAMGKFVVEQRRIGHTDVTLAFNSGGPTRLTDALRTRLMDDVEAALTYFEEAFGEYPLDDLTIVTLPRGFSQSYLGFITLTDSIVPPKLPPHGADVRWFRATTIAHEIAHQWWGNQVGWWSYRDQWLSEAMANYSALQFYADQEGRGSAYLAEMSAGWRESLAARTSLGRSVESLGPVVLGSRLNSSVAGNAYVPIVYRKGAVVLAMLARAIGEERFREMLRSLVEVASNKVLTTEQFIESLEHMSGMDLDGFARRFIYGTGIPEVYYGYRQDRTGDDEWQVRGEASLVYTPVYEQSIQYRGEGRWDVRRDIRARDSDEDAVLMVPFRLTVGDAEAADDAGSNGHVAAQSGSLFIEGTRDDFEIRSERQPLQLTLDPRGEILARFYAEDRAPKRVARFRAMDHLAQGRWDDAEASFRAALAAPVGPDAATRWLDNPASRVRLENARIRLGLARLYIDQDRDAEAEQELRIVEELVDADRTTLKMEREALWGRLEIRRGDSAAAFRRLKKSLRLAAPRRDVLTWRQRSWQIRLGSDWLATTDVFALLAIAAFETGNDDELRWALQGARDRGVDTSSLENGPRAFSGTTSD